MASSDAAVPVAPSTQSRSAPRKRTEAASMAAPSRAHGPAERKERVRAKAAKARTAKTASQVPVVRAPWVW